MNRIVNINIKGVVFPIEDDAYEMLKNYLERLRFHFKSNEGSTEIMDDIETRIAEILTQDPGKGNCVTSKHVHHVMEAMGNPSDFGDKEQSEFVPQPGKKGKYRRLMRDSENKVIGGVCSGMGAYFGLDPVWVRVFFLILFFGFGSGVILYIILWAILPEARTAAEKLEMRGERVTVDNIEKTIRDEFDNLKKNFKGRTGRRHKEGAGAPSGSRFLATVFSGVKKLVGLGLVFATLSITVVLVLAFFGVISEFPSIRILPFLSYVFANTAWGFVVYFSGLILILIPVLGLMVMGIRMLTGYVRKNRIVAQSMGGVWILSLLFVIGSVIYFSIQTKRHVTLTETVELQTSDSVHILTNNPISLNHKKFHLSVANTHGFRGEYMISGDSLKTPIEVDILHSDNGKMYVEILRSASGTSTDYAVINAQRIDGHFEQNGSDLLFNTYSTLSDNRMGWKLEAVKYKLYIPEGTQVYFGKNTAAILHHIQAENYLYGYKAQGNRYQMGDEGLKNGKVNITSENTDWNATKVLDFKGFQEVDLNGYFKVELIQQDSYLVVLNAPSEILDEIEYRKVGNELFIAYNPIKEILNSTERPTITIGLPYVETLELEGNIHTDVDIRSGNTIYLEMEGANTLAGSISAQQLKAEVNGANKVKLDGILNYVNLEINGASKWDAEYLEVNQMKMELNGSSSVTINCIENFKADVAGPSALRYKNHKGLSTKINNTLGRISTY